MLRVLATAFAALAGLAFGSFLNVCLARWPQGESIISPRSHCRSCNRTLAWWENVPLLSWLALRGRCRTCSAWIGWRYPLVEAAVGALWALVAWRSISELPELPGAQLRLLESGVIVMILQWLLVAVAVLDAENFWIPDFLTLPGIGVGLVAVFALRAQGNSFFRPNPLGLFALQLTGIVVAAAIILLIRAIYWLIRHREGMGLGDAKLMAMLAAWLGFSRALLSFGLAVAMGALAALLLVALRPARGSDEHWSAAKLPLGTFLCIGGIIASLWGGQIITAYLHWAGFY